MSVESDASRLLLLTLLDQIEKLLGDVRTAINNTEKGGNREHA